MISNNKILLFLVISIIICLLTGCRFFDTITGKDQFRIRVSVKPKNTGDIEMSDGIYTVEPIGAVYYEQDVVNITAIPKSDDNYTYKFDKWEGGSIDGNKSDTISFTAKETIDITANFYAEKFKVETERSEVKPKENFDITITAMDKNGNTITDYGNNGEKVNISVINQSLPMTIADAGNISFNNGIAVITTSLSFNDYNNNFGFVKIRVTEDENPHLRGDSDIITIAESLHQFDLSVKPLQNIYLGQPFTLTVSAMDMYDNPVYYSGNVDLTIDDGSVVLKDQNGNGISDVYLHSGQVEMVCVFTGGYGDIELMVSAGSISTTFPLSINRVPQLESFYVSNASSDTEMEITAIMSSPDSDPLTNQSGFIVLRSDEPLTEAPDNNLYNVDDTIGNGTVVYSGTSPADNTFEDTVPIARCDYYYTAFNYYNDNGFYFYSQGKQIINPAKEGQRIYVSDTNGDDTFSGTADDPYATVFEAIKSISTPAETVIIVAQGTYNSEKPLTLYDYISMYGGFIDDWSERVYKTEGERTASLTKLEYTNAGASSSTILISGLLADNIVEGFTIYGGTTNENLKETGGISISDHAEPLIRCNTIYGGTYDTEISGAVLSAVSISNYAKPKIIANTINGAKHTDTTGTNTPFITGIKAESSFTCKYNIINACEYDASSSKKGNATAVSLANGSNANIMFNTINGNLSNGVSENSTVVIDNSSPVLAYNYIYGPSNTSNSYTINLIDSESSSSAILQNNMIYSDSGASVLNCINIETDFYGSIRNNHIYGSTIGGSNSGIEIKEVEFIGDITGNHIQARDGLGMRAILNMATGGTVNISGNTMIGSLEASVGTTAVYNLSCQADINMNNNTIFSGRGGQNRGIHNQSCSGTINIYNNTINAGEDAGPNIGIYNQSCSGTINIYNNTIAVGGTDTSYPTYGAIYNDASSSLVYIKNNILFVSTEGSADYGIEGMASYTSEYNCFYGFEQGTDNNDGNVTVDPNMSNLADENGDGIPDWMYGYTLDNGQVSEGGTDLSNDANLSFTTDKDGKERTELWSMGAYEID